MEALHLSTLERKIQKSYGSHELNLLDWPYTHGHPTYNNAYIIVNSLHQIMVGIFECALKHTTFHEEIGCRSSKIE